jgi:nicotinamide riboside transporter PnuC
MACWYNYLFGFIWVFFTGKLYADMSLQVYYLVISIIGLYWWMRGTGNRVYDKNKSEAVISTYKDVLLGYQT